MVRAEKYVTLVTLKCGPALDSSAFLCYACNIKMRTCP